MIASKISALFLYQVYCTKEMIVFRSSHQEVLCSKTLNNTIIKLFIFSKAAGLHLPSQFAFHTFYEQYRRDALQNSVQVTFV